MILKRTTVIILIFFIITSSLVYSTQDTNKKSSFFKELFSDHGKLWSSPFHYNSQELIISILAAVITTYMIVNDESIYSRIKAYQAKNKWVSDMSPGLTLFGDGGLNLGLSGLFLVSGMILKSKKTSNTGKLLLMGLIHSGIIVQLLKHLTGRQRPEAESGVDKWSGPSAFFKRYKNHRDMFFDSFPSGHTITIWTTSTIIAHQYNRTPIVPVLSYSIAILSGLSRVTEDKHWLSDVFAGALLGFAIGKFVYHKRSNKFAVSPYISKNSLGLSISFKL